MKNLKRIVSIICAIAMILTVCVVSVSATTVTVTMNNNGTITAENLTPGEAMPIPGPNSLGEDFCGWYTDCVNWDAEDLVLTVPEEAVTVYARYPSTIIDFNNIKASAYTTGTNVSTKIALSDGEGALIAKRNLGYIGGTKFYGFYVPAYDANWTASEFAGYMLKPNTDYTIKVTFNSDYANAGSKGSFLPVIAVGAGVVEGDLPRLGLMQKWNKVMQECEATFTTGETVSPYLLLEPRDENSTYTFDKIIVTDSSVTVPAGLPTSITMNNNGVITSESLTPGDAMPNPGKNTLGEDFLGWYTDPQNWTGKVETVPEEPITVYAKYPSVIIDFNHNALNGITSTHYFNSYFAAPTVSDGNMVMKPWGDAHGVAIPAYDAALSTFTPFKMETSGNYTVKMYLKTVYPANFNNELRLAYACVDPASPNADLYNDIKYNFNLAASDDYQEISYTIGSVPAENKTGLVLSTPYWKWSSWGLNANNTYMLYVDKIIITNNNAELPAGYVTMNNNGTITTAALTPGDAMPNPGVNELGETFLGWYTDCQNWTGKVETVPEEATTVYARYPSIIIDFNNIKSSAYTPGATASSKLELSNGDGALVVKRNYGYVGGTKFFGFYVPAYDVNWSQSEFAGYMLKPNTNYTIKATFNSDYAKAASSGSFLPVIAVDAGVVEGDLPRLGLMQKWNKVMQECEATFTTGETVSPYLLLEPRDENSTYTFDKIIITDNSLIAPVLPELPANVEADYETGTITVTPDAGKIVKGIYVDGAKVSVSADANPNVVTVDGLANTSVITVEYADNAYIGWGSVRNKTAEISTGVRFRARTTDANIIAATEAGFLIVPERLIASGSTAAADLVLNSANNMVLDVPVTGYYADITNYTDYQLCITDLMPDERGLESGRDFRFETFSVVFYVKTAEDCFYSTPIATSFTEQGGNIDPVDITMNNNGSISTQALTPFTAMPNPGKNELDEDFLGWYTDCVNWSESSKVTVVPSYDTTVYAKYPSVIIDFKNLKASAFTPGTTVNSQLALSNGEGTLISNRVGDWIDTYTGFIAPAYDADWTAAEFKGYQLKPSTDYRVTVTYQSNSTNSGGSYIGLYPVNAGSIQGVAVNNDIRLNSIEAYGNSMGNRAAEFATGESVNTNLLLTHSREKCIYTFDKIIITNVTESVAHSSITINGTKYVSSFVDEFNGTTLNTTKWAYGPEQQRQNLGAYWDNDMVEVKDGALHLNTGWDSENNRAISGAVVTQNLFQQTYGYWEASMKFPTTPTAFWGGFWLYTPNMPVVGNGGSDGAEIDILETISNKSGTAQHNIHWDGYGESHKDLGAQYISKNFNIYDGNYHTFALEWTETYYKFYVDGTCTLTIDQNHSKWSQIVGTANDPAYILLSIEFGTSTGITNALDASHTGKSILVDYVRVYKKAE